MVDFISQAQMRAVQRSTLPCRCVLALGVRCLFEKKSTVYKTPLVQIGSTFNHLIVTSPTSPRTRLFTENFPHKRSDVNRSKISDTHFTGHI